MSKIFNPNELILEKIRAVEEYDPATLELTGRYTQIEEPSLKTSADATVVTDSRLSIPRRKANLVLQIHYWH